MKFWDTSALVPLIVGEPSGRALRRLLKADSSTLVWWGTRVEVVSAVARLGREGKTSATEENEMLADYDAWVTGFAEVQPTVELRAIAQRLLRSHALRAADALQLAAALVSSEAQPSALEFISLDHRLNDAARREGLAVIEVVDGVE